MRYEGREADLKVDRFEGMKHGWTQMPVSWLGEKEKRMRLEIDEEVGFGMDGYVQADTEEDGEGYEEREENRERPGRRHRHTI